MDNNFIGVGRNPDGPDIPLGLGMQLAQHPKAMTSFGKMTKKQKEDMIRNIQSAVTGEDAERRIINAVNGLDNGQEIR